MPTELKSRYHKASTNVIVLVQVTLQTLALLYPTEVNVFMSITSHRQTLSVTIIRGSDVQFYITINIHLAH